MSYCLNIGQKICHSRQDGVSAALEWPQRAGKKLTLSSTSMAAESRIAPVRVHNHGCRERMISPLNIDQATQMTLTLGEAHVAA